MENVSEMPQKTVSWRGRGSVPLDQMPFLCELSMQMNLDPQAVLDAFADALDQMIDRAKAQGNR